MKIKPLTDQKKKIYLFLSVSNSYKESSKRSILMTPIVL